MRYSRCTFCDADAERQPDCAECRATGMFTDIPFCDEPWNELIPGLWLGGHLFGGGWSWNANRTAGTEMLLAERFDVVVSFYAREGCNPLGPTEHHYLRIVDGHLDARELDEVYDLAVLVAMRVREGKKVLVRCQAGLNRSSLCAALALQELGHTIPDAIKLIREKRSPYALFNGYFVDFLMANQRGEASA